MLFALLFSSRHIVVVLFFLASSYLLSARCSTVCFCCLYRLHIPSFVFITSVSQYVLAPILPFEPPPHSPACPAPKARRLVWGRRKTRAFLPNRYRYHSGGGGGTDHHHHHDSGGRSGGQSGGKLYGNPPTSSFRHVRQHYWRYRRRWRWWCWWGWGGRGAGGGRRDVDRIGWRVGVNLIIFLVFVLGFPSTPAAPPDFAIGSRRVGFVYPWRGFRERRQWWWWGGGGGGCGGGSGSFSCGGCAASS